MALFEFRLEAADGSGHFRRGTIAADSEEEAREFLLDNEREYEGYRLTTEQIDAFKAEYGDDVVTAALEAPPEAKLVGLPGRVRAEIAMHRQTAPYKLKTLSEVKD